MFCGIEGGATGVWVLMRVFLRVCVCAGSSCQRPRVINGFLPHAGARTEAHLLNWSSAPLLFLLFPRRLLAVSVFSHLLAALTAEEAFFFSFSASAARLKLGGAAKNRGEEVQQSKCSNVPI